MQAIWDRLTKSIPFRNQLKRPIAWFLGHWHSDVLDRINSRTTELEKRLALLLHESSALLGQYTRQEQALDNLARQNIQNLESATVAFWGRCNVTTTRLNALLDERTAKLQNEAETLVAGLSQQLASLDKLLNEPMMGESTESGKSEFAWLIQALRSRFSPAHGDSQATTWAAVPLEGEMQKLDRQGLFVIGRRARAPRFSSIASTCQRKYAFSKSRTSLSISSKRILSSSSTLDIGPTTICSAKTPTFRRLRTEMMMRFVSWVG